MTTTTVKCRQSARLLCWVRGAIITFFILFLLKLLAGCSTLSGTITVPTDYGTAVIRSNGGKTSVDLELPRR